MLHVEAVTTFEGLLSLKDAWNQVLAKSGANSIYLTWEWIVTWWRHFEKRDDNLFIVIVKKRGEIVTIMPCMKSCYKYHGLPVTEIKLITNDYTPYSDVIFTVDAAESMRRVLDFLKTVKWDIINLRAIPSDSTTNAVINSIQNDRNTVIARCNPENKNPHIHFTKSWEEYYEGLAPTFKKNLSRHERNLSKIGEVTLEEVTQDSNLDALLRRAFEIEHSGWKGEQKTSIFHNVDARQFFIEMAKIASRANRLRLFFLKAGGERIAFDYSFASDGIIDSTKIGYDDRFSRYSPGTILQKHILKKVMGENYLRYNFRGKNTKYKENWTSHTDAFEDLLIYKKTLYSKLLYFLRFPLKKYSAPLNRIILMIQIGEWIRPLP